MAYKKISELSGTTSPSLTGVTVVVDGGTTYKSTLGTLRSILVDSGSHVFTGSQTINGNLTISGSLTAQQYILSSSVTNMTIESISGSTAFGNSLDDTHNFTGSLKITGSITDSGFLVLSQVSSSLDFVNDASASTGGVPLGGLYRSGSFILIRLT